MKYLLVFFLFGGYAKSFAQQQYTDFHTHITTKHYYRDIKSVYEIIDSNCNERAVFNIKDMPLLNWEPFGFNSKAKRNGKESNFVNYDQANFSELKNMSGSILCNSFYPFEKIMALRGFDRLINHLFASRLSLKRLRRIASDHNSPFREFMAEYYFAKNQSTFGKDSSRIIFVRDSAELAYKISKNFTSYIMTIEGGQVLSDLYASNAKRIKSWYPNENTDQEILSNVIKLKNLPHRLFFVTISHFSWNRVSGFAKTLDKVGFRRKAISFFSSFEKQRAKFFYKPGEGIHGKVGIIGDSVIAVNDSCFDVKGKPIEAKSLKYSNELTIGSRVIAEFLNPQTSAFHKPTYIDIKHMDILSRMQYYHIRDSLVQIYKINIPLIASHVAVSGENLAVARATGLYPNFDKYQELTNPEKYYADQIKYHDCEWILRNGGINPFTKINPDAVGWFYPWSINLYEEEISKIHESDGIMGVMLDGRQLGGGMPNYKKASYKNEVIKKFDSLKTNYKHRDFSEYYEAECFIRNIIYIAKHCGNTICWDHISLGSDFDGLIHPLKICPSTQAIPIFKDKIIDYFKIYIQIHSEWSVVNNISAEKIIDKIFYTNGKRFIIKYF